MDQVIDTRFDRIEKALATLITSIANYNPSNGQTDDLVAAEKELSKGLGQVTQHQNNHLRIQTLKSTTASLDTQIRSTLLALASTRKDITSTPTTVFPPGPTHPLPYDELLSYARRISKTTLPPPGVTNGVDPDGTSDIAPTPAGTTPGGGATPSAALTPLPNGVATPSQNTTTALPPDFVAGLNPLAGQVFIPWPREDLAGRGALAGNALLLRQSVDLRAYDPEAEERRREAEAGERVRREEAEREVREEEERVRREEAERVREEMMARKKAGEGAGVVRSGGGGGGGGQSQFQFAGADDDDDDDDDR